MGREWMKGAVYLCLTATLGGAMIWGLSTADQVSAEESATEMGAHADHLEQVAIVGDLHIFSPVLRETPPNAPAAAGFLTVMNMGHEDDRLIAVSAEFAERGELHDMVVEDDVMRMREVEGGMLAPAGEALTLDPMTPGLHLMFIDLKQPLVAGEEWAVTLTFENSGEATIVFPVERIARHGAGAMGGHGMHGHEMEGEHDMGGDQ